MVRSLAERYYASVTRYTTSSFVWLKLSEPCPVGDCPRTFTKAAKKP